MEGISVQKNLFREKMPILHIGYILKNEEYQGLKDIYYGRLHPLTR